MGRDTADIKRHLAALQGNGDSKSLEALAAAGLRVFHLKGDGITGKTEFLDRIAAVMDFPSYFGHNWDALDDCLTDLAWVDHDELVLFYEGYRPFADASPEEWATAEESLKEAEAYWAKEGPPRLHLVLKK